MNFVTNLPSYNVENLRVLIIDEHEQLRTVVCGVLRNLGIRNIREAESVEQGYTLFCDTNPDITFVDWTPEFDGIGILNKIRTDPESPNPFAAVVVMTGYSEAYHVQHARDAGMDSYLAKPVSAERIYKHIVSLIDNRKNFVKSREFFGPDRRRKRQQGFQGKDKRT